MEEAGLVPNKFKNKINRFNNGVARIEHIDVLIVELLAFQYIAKRNALCGNADSPRLRQPSPAMQWKAKAARQLHHCHSVCQATYPGNRNPDRVARPQHESFRRDDARACQWSCAEGKFLAAKQEPGQFAKPALDLAH